MEYILELFFGKLQFWILVFEYCADLTEQSGVRARGRFALKGAASSSAAGKLRGFACAFTVSVGQRARETVFRPRKGRGSPHCPTSCCTRRAPRKPSIIFTVLSVGRTEAHDLRHNLGRRRRRRRRRRRHANRAAAYIRSRAPGRNHHIHTGDGRVRTLPPRLPVTCIVSYTFHYYVFVRRAAVRLRSPGRFRSRGFRARRTTTATAAPARGRVRRRRIRHGRVVGAGRLFLRRRGRRGHGVPQVQSADGAGQSPRQVRVDRRRRRHADRPSRQVAGRRPASRPGRPRSPGRGPGRRQQERPAGRHAGHPHGQAHVDQDHRSGRCRSRRSQEEGQGHATGHDDGRYDGSGGNGSVGFQNVGTACRKGAITEQNRTGFVWDHSTQEASAATTGRTRIRVGVPSLRSELATTRSS